MELDWSAHDARYGISNRPQHRSRNGSQHTIFSTQSSKASTRSQHSRSEQMTPPLTPSTSTEDLSPTIQYQSQFHNYLRAVYPYHPPCDDSTASVTLPLNQGDLVLIHSVHVNGWADGTLLTSSKRGWLPTNYCEAYSPPPMNRLMGALTTFYDIMICCDEDGSLVSLGNQDYMRGLVAGIRFLFESTGCLNRDSPMLAINGGISNLRRHRKAILAELSSLVKLAKTVDASLRVQDSSLLEPDTLERMLAISFKMAIRAAKFHEVWSESAVAAVEQRRLVISNIDIIASSSMSSVPPPTPPAEVTHFREVEFTSQPESDLHIPINMSFESDITSETSSALASPREDTAKQLDGLTAPCMEQTSTTNTRTRPKSLTVSQPMTHRISWTTKSNGQRNNKLASERLLNTHETFLSHLQVFISSQIRSRSRTDILLHTHRILNTGRALMTVVDAVWDRGQRSLDFLNGVRDKMYGRIADLVDAARHIFQPSEHCEDGEYAFEDLYRIEDAATACVRGAGKCVETTRRALVFIGDFEFETLEIPLGSPCQGKHPEESVEPVEPVDPVEVENASVQPQESLQIEAPQIIIADNTETQSPTETESPETPTAEDPQIKDEATPAAKPPMSPTRLNRELPPAPPKIDTGVASPDMVPKQGEPTSASSITSSGFLAPLSSIGTPSTWQTERSPMSLLDPTGDAVPQTPLESKTPITTVSSVVSNERTAATEQSLSESFTAVSMSSSVSTLDTPLSPVDSIGGITRNTSTTSLMLKQPTNEDSIEAETEEVEATMLQSTYAHELVFKDGVVVGGTVQALVERLTAHDSTPDALFVSTFYLTFRLFTTPIAFAQALVNRYEGIDMNLKSAAPIKLRVYNVFKSWMEVHWRAISDEPALALIKDFAKDKLSPLLPSCGQRLSHLADKLQTSGSHRPTVTFVPHSAPDQAPTVNITYKQKNLLKDRNNGGTLPAITDFNAEEIARQLTLKAAAIFDRIAPEELTGCEWTKKSASIAVNVRSMIQLSTDLTNLVVDTILQHEEPPKRAKTIKHWLKIGRECVKLKNFDAVTAILSSVNNSTIRRLKKTWEATSQKTIALEQELSNVVDLGKNFKGLRTRLHSINSACIPFIGMYLTDLTFVDAGNQATRLGADGITEVINFDRYSRTVRIIQELQRFKGDHQLRESLELQAWIQEELVRVRSATSGDSSFYKRSLVLEPREFAKPAGAVSGIPVPVTDSTVTIHTRTARERVEFLGGFFNKSANTAKSAEAANSSK